MIFERKENSENIDFQRDNDGQVLSHELPHSSTEMKKSEIVEGV